MSPGTRFARGSRLALRCQIVVAMYVLAAMALPLAHHDVVCHAKTPTHCITCVIASSGDVAADPSALARLGLNDAGSAPAHGLSQVASRLDRAPSGRAPPTSA